MIAELEEFQRVIHGMPSLVNICIRYIVDHGLFSPDQDTHRLPTELVAALKVANKLT